jgi:hypothetical protein
MAQDSSKSSPIWPTWASLVLFTFISFESTLLAVALKGSWFILLAPGIVCATKALDTWRELRKRLGIDGSADKST